MTSKELMYAAFDGSPRDRFPVVVPYTTLLQREHWEEVMGEPPWTYHRWLYADPEDHVRAYRELDQALPFDLIEPVGAAPRATREHIRVQRRQDGPYVIHTRTGEARRVSEDLAHMAPAANQERRVFTRRDVGEQVVVAPAADAIAAGCNDYIARTVEVMGGEKFILSGGVTGTFWGCTFYVGQTNLFALVREEPALVEYLSGRLLEQTIERIRVLGASGGDAIFIDDAITTCEMISLKDYERFSMPYVREMVREIRAHGMKAILVYFGGVADRLEHIASLGADGLMVETTMKNYVNDIGRIADRLGGGMCLFGNIDPVNVVQRGSEERLRGEIERQAEVGRRHGRFVISTGSPVTPLTPVRRIRQFIDVARGAAIASNETRHTPFAP